MDIGRIIKQEFDRSGLSISQFAKLIHKERSLIYNIFKRKSIDTELLFDICMALNVDLFKNYSTKLEDKNLYIKESNKSNINKNEMRKVMLEIELSSEEYKKLIGKIKLD